LGTVASKGEGLKVEWVELFGEVRANGVVPAGFRKIQMRAQRAEQGHVEAAFVGQEFLLDPIGSDQDAAGT
jgi:hypothetical protein